MRQPSGTSTGAANVAPTFKDHQQDVLELVQQSSELLAKTGELFDDSSRARFASASAELREEHRKVRQLELRLAVVAPMKAGKSTIINAVAGRNLLPVRNSAMTTLPTEIVCSHQHSEPALVLSEKCIQLCESAARALQDHIGRMGLEGARAKMAHVPGLDEAVRAAAKGALPKLQPRVTGQAAIHATLHALNDLNRMCAVLAKDAVLLQALDVADVPRLETPPGWGAKVTAGEGSLVLVDTPGPNESDSSLDLRGVVEQQLHVASMVLLVLDYTQLNTEAAASIRNSVRDIVGRIGEDKLFIAVNRIDQRGQDGMSAEDVRTFVRAHLGLEKLDLTHRLFEMSAALAFDSARVLQALRDRPDDLAEARAVAEPLYRRVRVLDWSKVLPRESAAALQSTAELAWDEFSHFPAFLDGAVGWVQTRVGPECLSAALNKASKFMKDLARDTSLRGGSIKASAQRLAEEAEQLRHELEEVGVMRRALQERADATKKKLRTGSAQLLEQLEKDAYVDADVFAQEKGGGEKGNWLERLARKLDGRGKDDHRRFTFESKRKAERFLEEAVERGRSHAEQTLVRGQKELFAMVEQSRQELGALARERVQPILTRATGRLSVQLNVTLTLPEPELRKPTVPVVSPAPDEKTRIIRGEKRDAVRYERRWYTIWMYQHKVEYTVREPDVEVSEYHVDLSDVVKAVNKAMRQAVRSLEDELTSFARDELEGTLSEYLVAVEAVLSNYQEHLTQARRQQSKSESERSRLAGDLEALHRSALACSAEFERSIRRNEALRSARV
jgi:predicted GTPase